MKLRKVIAILLVVVLLGTGIPAHAEMAPEYVNTSMIMAEISFRGSQAVCASVVDAFNGTSKIQETMYLYRKESSGTYTLLKSWSNTVYWDLLGVEQVFYVLKGYTYRINCIASVTRNGYTETVYAYSESRCS